MSPTREEIQALLQEQLPSAPVAEVSRCARVVELLLKMAAPAPAAARGKSTGRRFKDRPVAESMNLKKS